MRMYIQNVFGDFRTRARQPHATVPHTTELIQRQCLFGQTGRNQPLLLRNHTKLFPLVYTRFALPLARTKYNTATSDTPCGSESNTENPGGRTSSGGGTRRTYIVCLHSWRGEGESNLPR